MDFNRTLLDQIEDLCLKHKVKSLHIFGSVLSSRFNESSDIDLIVDFKEMDLYDYADNFYSLKEALETLLQRNIDLVEANGIKNPILKQELDATKRKIYDIAG